jgi:hypothetical protein
MKAAPVMGGEKGKGKTTTGMKRKRTVNTPNTSTKPSTPVPGNTAKKEVIRYSPEMHEAIIRFFQEQALAGAFLITRKGAMKEGFEAVARGMKSRFPDKEWPVDKMSTKYDTEKRKYRIFLNFLEISGTSYVEETGLLDGSSENWDRFQRLYTGTAWLRKPFPLGRNVNAYADIFAKEKPSGQIVQSSHEMEQDDDDSDDPFMEEEEADQDEEPEQDKGHEEELDEQEKLEQNVRSKRTRMPGPDKGQRRSHKKVHSTPTPALGLGIFDSLAKALELNRHPLLAQQNNLQQALEDLRDNYQTKLTAVQRYRLGKKLQEDPSAPLAWITADDEVRELIIEEWLA